MKRGAPLKRGGPLKRTTPITVGEGPLRKTPLKRYAPRPKSKSGTPEVERNLMAAWWLAVTHTTSGVQRRCIMCGTKDDIQGHHAVPKQALKREARSRNVDPGILVWDPANGVPLCRRDHERHTLRAAPVPGYLLPDATWEWARTLGLDHLLEREHPTS